MKNKCLYCYEALDESMDFHEKCCKKFFGTKTPPQIPYSNNQMIDLAKNIIERSISIPGVQAKLSMSLTKELKTKGKSRLTAIGALGGQFILKPPSENYSQMPENEHLSMRIAEAFGINVVQSCLIKLESGELSYLTKRIDRDEKGEKIHMLDMFQITEANDKYKSSLEKVGKALDSYSDNTILDKIFFFELCLFSFLMGNNDMHLKNFSMIETLSGWILAPAYDLLNVAIILPDDTEELALTVQGKKRKLNKENFEKLGKDLKLSDKQILGVFKRMIANKPKAIHWIDKSFLSEENKNKYKNIIELRYHQLNFNNNFFE
jgi:serine/threonine-protein kinase HipA